MARGQPDYYTEVVPSAGIFGEGQLTFFAGESGEIPALSSAVFVEYEVPVGHELHVVAGCIDSDFPATQQVFTLVSGVPISRLFYDTFLALPIHTAAAYVVDVGDILSFALSNLDSVAHNYDVGIAGFLVKKGA